MTRFVVDAGVVLHILAEDSDVAPEHQLVAPTLIRSQVLARLYQSVRTGELSEETARERLARFSHMKIRCLSDKVLRRKAWDVAQQLGWDSTEDAEYIALTGLQADAFVTLDADLERAAAGVVATDSIEALFR